MTANGGHRFLVFIWAMVLASPLAWAASLVSMFWLTHPVCQGLSRSSLILTGFGCALVALTASSAAGRALRCSPGQWAEDGQEVAVLLLQLARWSGLIFALVIVLSLVPTALLTPCPV